MIFLTKLPTPAMIREGRERMGDYGNGGKSGRTSYPLHLLRSEYRHHQGGIETRPVSLAIALDNVLMFARCRIR